MIMSLTDIHPGIQHFFEHELMPLASETKRQQDVIPWIPIDADASTYYITRQKTTMSKQDFESGGHSSVETIAADLTAFWNEHDDANMCKLAPSLSALAKELRVVEDQNEEISPFVYVMF